MLGAGLRSCAWPWRLRSCERRSAAAHASDSYCGPAIGGDFRFRSNKAREWAAENNRDPRLPYGRWGRRLMGESGHITGQPQRRKFAAVAGLYSTVFPVGTPKLKAAYRGAT